MSKAPLVTYGDFSSPIGRMYVARSAAGVCRICLPNEKRTSFMAWLKKWYPEEEVVQDRESLSDAAREITAYLRGESRSFSFALDLKATPFRRRVLDRVRRIRYGETVSYKDVAARTGNPTAVRAVAGAVAANPLPLVIPCHRVVAHDGSLGGYGGGLSLKRRLLSMEGAL